MNQQPKTTEEQSSKLLQGANVPKQYIENIRQLIWSNDPANELAALELVIHQGLPKELIIDFIVAAKKGRNEETRDRIKDFLANQISDGAKQVLNNPTVILGSSISFYHYEKLISNSEIAQLAAAYYKRDRRSDCLSAFFRYDDGTSPYRQNMLALLLPIFLRKPEYLKIQVNFTVEELNQVLKNPAFNGKLERVVISSQLMTSIPKELLKHQTIKELELRGAFESATLPVELKQLTQLKSGHYSRGYEAGISWTEGLTTGKF